MRRLSRHLGIGTGLIAAVYLVLSVLLALVPGPRAAIPAGQGVVIGLLPGLIHYDLLLPLTPVVRQRFAFASRAGVAVDDPAKRWLLLGHGGRASYTTTGTYADLSARAVWLGATGDRTVMRLDTAGPVRDDIGIAWLQLGSEQFKALLDFAQAGFAAPPRALPGPGLGPHDVFFAGTGRANILQTCNSWVGQALRDAGHPFGLWTPATWSVRLSLWRFADRGAARAQSPEGGAREEGHAAAGGSASKRSLGANGASQ